MRFYSVIIPVYNRPDELDELLYSLTQQTYKNFEVIIVEDGSDKTCKLLIEKYQPEIALTYHYKENTGQGFSRNYGFDRAKGDYFIVFDSDCIIPPNYFESVEKALNTEYFDAYGGPDRAGTSFSAVQKAINYSMTSLFTTGGIRGNKKHAGTYHPRSFNMGISREVFEQTKGYLITRKGEDIDLSIRILKAGFKIGLIEEAFVYHKRRTSVRQFYRQLKFFGRARVNIKRMHVNELKLVHLFPMFFLFGLIFALSIWIFFPIISALVLVGYGLFYSLILIDSTIRNKSLGVGLLSIITSTVQLSAYALGMIAEFISPQE